MVRLVYVYALVAVIYGGSTFSDARIPPPRQNSRSITDHVQKRLSEADINRLNDYIVKYLLYFEKLRQISKYDYTKQTMNVVKLLIVHSWVSTLEPDLGLLSIPQKVRLQEFTNSVEYSIRKIEHTDMTDHIVHYVNKIEPLVRNELESEKNSFKYSEKVFYDDERVLAEKHDDETITYFETTWNGILDVLDEIRSNLIIHKISTRMILQSYIENFISDRRQLRDKFTLTSSHGPEVKFDTPDVGLGIYDDIMEITNEVDTDIKSNDKIKYEVYIHILNERIRKYLETFDKLIEEENEQLKKAMATVKSLMIQGWIDTMEPGPEFFPIGRTQAIATKREEIVRKLKEDNIYFRVNDDIIIYTDEKEKEIENKFKTKSDALEKQYRLKLETLKSIKEKPENKEEIDKIKEELKELERQMNVENDNLVGHEICKLFYLNSFREDFIPEKERKIDFTVEASKFSRGNARYRDFNVPLKIEIKDFFSGFVTIDE